MKIAVIAFKMFRQHIKLNLLLILELSITLLIMVYALNAYTINNAKVDILQNAKDGFFYWSFPPKISSIYSYFKNPNNDKAKKLQKLNDFMKDNPWIKGVSVHEDSFIITDKKKAEKNLIPEFDKIARVMLYDNLTLENFHYPLATGKWFDNFSELQKGYIPCVIGGGTAAKYKVGDIITGYENRYPKSNLPLVENKFIVIGKLREPNYTWALNTTIYMYDNNKANYNITLFQAEITDSLLMISPISMVKRSLGKSGRSKIDSEIVYYDKKATIVQIQKLSELLSSGYSIQREDLISITSNERDETLYTFGTVFILMLAVSFVGLISMCILTTIKSIEKFKIYFLVGATRAKTISITLMFALYFIILSGGLFVTLLRLAYSVNNFIFPSYYFELYPNTILGLIIVTLPLVLFSFLLPFLEISRTNIINLLKK